MQRGTSKEKLLSTPRERSQECGILGLIGLGLLLLFGILRAPGVGINCFQTYVCATTVRHPYYHCEENKGLGYEFAIISELTTESFAVVSKIIFLVFSWKVLSKRPKREVCWPCIAKKLLLPKTLIFLATCGVCIWSYGALYSNEKDLGPRMKEAIKDTIILYIIDTLLIAAIIIALNYVQIQDLSDYIRPSCSFKKPCHPFRKVNLAWLILKFVILLWILEYLSYLVLESIQTYFGVVEVTNNKSENEKPENKAIYTVLKHLGRIAFLGLVTSYLFFKFCDDGKLTVGKRTDENDPNACCAEIARQSRCEGENKEYSPLSSYDSSLYVTCEVSA